jgi:hypothetical protein
MEVTMDVETARKIIWEYQDLLERALNVVDDVPFYARVDNEESARLDIDGDKAILSWTYYEADYYDSGGYDSGGCSNEQTSFPVDMLFISDDELAAMREMAKVEEAEKEARLMAAQASVAIQQKEQHDRAEYERLCAKYGKQTIDETYAKLHKQADDDVLT